jgi:hypothetical protein
MCIICKTKNIEELIPLTCLFINCDIIQNIPKEMVNLEILVCIKCPLLTNFPDTLRNLEHIICHHCFRLEKIPSTFIKLTRIECSFCTALEYIPNTFVNIEYIDCCGCNLIKSIPSNFTRLKYLDCSNCRLMIEIPSELVNLYTIECRECPWLPQNIHTPYTDYKENIKILIECQTFIKKYILSKRIITLAKQLIPLWWNPSLKGGYFYKKIMLEEIENLVKQ